MRSEMSRSDRKQRLAAILCADAAGYSRLMSLDEGATLDALDAAREVFRTHIEVNQGRVIDMAGDSVLALFETSTGAVHATLAVQQELAAALADVQEHLRLQFRIGVHLGDVIEKADGTVYGDGVNIAARLQALAEPGGIIVSESIHMAVRGKVPADFEDQGEQTVKNIAHPVRTYRVLLQAGALIAPVALAGRATAASIEIDLSLPDKPSIAVLPFANMSGDPEQEYFTDGISEDIITELSRFHSLFVVARNSSFSYKGKSPDIRQVGRELGVRYVLEGSIRRSGSRIRVTAQLIDALTGTHIWAERYDRVQEDIFALQEELTQAIVAAIAPQIEASELTRATRRRPGNLSAYELALRAWAHASGGGVNGDAVTCHLAIREANEALAIDPESTLALMALAWGHAALLFLQFAPDPAHTLQEMRTAAMRAVESDRSNASALALKAVTVMTSLQFEQYPQALADGRRAHEINPNDAFVLLMLVIIEAVGGEPEQAIEHGKLFLRLNPRDTRLHLLFNGLASASFAAKRYEDGIRWALRAIHDMPRMPMPYLLLANCHVGIGEIDKAKAAFATLVRIAPLFAQSRIDGPSSQGRVEDRHRGHIFTRIAAGLEAPSAADGLR
jgi:adenylate cyclase